jgi:hypothetical protein
MIEVYQSAQPSYIVSDVLPATIKKINSFVSLPVGWHYGSGTAPSAGTIKVATSMHNFFVQVGLTATDAFPGINGEIMVTAYKENYYVECLIEANGNYSVIGEENKKEFAEVYNVNESKALDTLVNVVGTICNTSGFYTHGIMTLDETNSKALPFAIHLMAVVLPSSNAVASTGKVSGTVGTSGSFTGPSRQNRQSSGNFPVQSSQMDIHWNGTTPTGMNVTSSSAA